MSRKKYRHSRRTYPVSMIISKNESEKISTPKSIFLDFFREAPFPELDLDIERDKDLGRNISI